MMLLYWLLYRAACVADRALVWVLVSLFGLGDAVRHGVSVLPARAGLAVSQTWAGTIRIARGAGRSARQATTRAGRPLMRLAGSARGRMGWAARTSPEAIRRLAGSARPQVTAVLRGLASLEAELAALAADLGREALRALPGAAGELARLELALMSAVGRGLVRSVGFAGRGLWAVRGLLAASMAVAGLAIAGSSFLNTISVEVLSAADFVEDERDKGIEILDRRGDRLYLWTEASGGFRRSVPLDQVSPFLIDAAISTEDADFWENPGLSGRGIARAAYENLAFWETGGLFQGSGGSSITQQLAKNLYVPPDRRSERSAWRKIAEAYLALQLNERYSKEEILERYLNLVFFGNGAYGAEAAAQRYFGKAASQLTLAEAALLAGIPRAPSEYDPLLPAAQRARWPLDTLVRLSNEDLLEIGSATPEGLAAFLATLPTDRLAVLPPAALSVLPPERRPGLPEAVQASLPPHDPEAGVAMPEPSGLPNRGAKERQEHVLDLMVRHGYLTPGEALVAKTEPLEFHPSRFPIQAPHFVLHVIDLLKARYGAHALRGGLRVTTSLNMDLQRLGEQLVAARVAEAGPAINGWNAALVAMSPHTGEVLAMVGSADYFDPGIDGQVNMATARRQPGSSFKPFTYASAFLKGYTPATTVLDAPATFVDASNRRYAPQNFDGQYRGTVSFRTALSNSLNVPAVKAMAAVGIDTVLDVARRMGITTLDQPHYGLSLALGAAEVRLLDLTHAYAAFGHQGALPGAAGASGRVEPVAILRVEDGQGNVLEEFTTPQSREVLPPQVAYLITHVLSDDEARAPTFGQRLRLPGGRPAAVKTGTTENLRDFWTVGYTPDLVTGVWMGNADNAPLTAGFSGSTTGPLWEQFMAAAHGANPHTVFPQPPGIASALVCANTGQAPGRGCSRIVTEVFPEHLVPAPAPTYGSPPPPSRRPAPTPTRGRSRGRD